MATELKLWQFIADHLRLDQTTMLLVVAESSGSSPGRAGYKMAVAADGELCGSIGGGVMEVALAEAAKLRIENRDLKIEAEIVEQVHQKNARNASGMICSGRQTVIFKELTNDDNYTVMQVIDCLNSGAAGALEVSHSSFQVIENARDKAPFFFMKKNETEFVYQEQLGHKHRLYIIGGGHCALALSEMMSRLGFRISIFDDRPDLNTIEKNHFADEVRIVESYQNIGDHIASDPDVFVVVMTLGYAFDEIVIRNLIDKDFRYFGVLGSKAKMKALLNTLKAEGFRADRLSRIRAPVGLPINSRTPEEIAVSIAAEIISVKNTE